MSARAESTPGAEPIRVWRLDEVGGPEWTAAKVAELEAERAERTVELQRAYRRRDAAARKVERLTAVCDELTNRLAALRTGHGR
jgi:hypothetical protein